VNSTQGIGMIHRLGSHRKMKRREGCIKWYQSAELIFVGNRGNRKTNLFLQTIDKGHIMVTSSGIGNRDSSICVKSRKRSIDAL
jgi:hypothetical protein